MPLELERNTVDLVKRRLAESGLQHRQAIQVVRIVPVDLPQLQIRPIRDPARWKLERAIAGLYELRQGRHSVKKSGSAIGSELDARRGKVDAIGLFGEPRAVAVERRPDL